MCAVCLWVKYYEVCESPLHDVSDFVHFVHVVWPGWFVHTILLGLFLCGAL